MIRLSTLLLGVLGVVLLLGACETTAVPANLESHATSVTTYRALLSGNQEVPAVTTDARGRAIFQVRAQGTELHYRVLVSDLEDVVAAHIHLAPAGTNGSVVAFLLGQAVSGESNGLLAEGVITAGDLVGPLAGATLADLTAALEAGNAYVNVHTLEHPGGEIRGQIRSRGVPARTYRARLSGDQEVPAVTTEAQGQATFQLLAQGTELHYRVVVSKLEDVVASHIHLAPAGTNGAVVAFLFNQAISGESNGVLAAGVITSSDLVGPLAGATLTGLIAALEAGDAYVNVHTVEHPGGELRGQIR